VRTLSHKSSLIFSGIALLVVLAALFIFAPQRTPNTPVTNVYPQHIGAMGDSMTVGANAKKRGDNLDLSWVTGKDKNVNSIAYRIKTASGSTPSTENVAVSGARSSALEGQAKKLVKTDATFTTIFIGANDVCTKTVDSMTAVSVYEKNVSAALNVLKENNVSVSLASNANITQLLGVGEKSSVARTLWSRANICPSLLTDASTNNEDSAERSKAVLSRIKEFNAVLAKLCDEYGKNCAYDNGAVFNVTFDANDLSTFDYFHPNANGQKKLAEAVWPAVVSLY
jgi:lysophospholipase L1-like esterase